MAHTHYLTQSRHPATQRQLTAKKSTATLTKQDAEALISNISKGSYQVFTNTVLLVNQKAYQVLGFETPQACLRKKVPSLSNSYICRLLRAAFTYLKVDAELTHLNRVTESTFRPLQDVSETEANKVWQNVLAKRGATKPIAARHIKSVMQALGIAVKAKAPATAKQPPIKLSQSVQQSMTQSLNKLSKLLIAPNVTTHREWEQFANLIYQQLLTLCPLPTTVKEAAS